MFFRAPFEYKVEEANKMHMYMPSALAVTYPYIHTEKTYTHTHNHFQSMQNNCHAAQCTLIIMDTCHWTPMLVHTNYTNVLIKTTLEINKYIHAWMYSVCGCSLCKWTICHITVWCSHCSPKTYIWYQVTGLEGR